MKTLTCETAELKNFPELLIGRFLKAKSLGGNRVIAIVMSSLRPLMEKRFLDNHTAGFLSLTFTFTSSCATVLPQRVNSSAESW